MAALGLGFAAPWVLWGLLGLPVLWLVLRALPPAPRRLRFAGLALLDGLPDAPPQAIRTPWWLVLLRALALALALIGFAGPVLGPVAAPEGGGTGPLLLVVDDSWAAARDWPTRRARAEDLARAAALSGRPVALFTPADPGPASVFAPGVDLAGLAPRPWLPRRPEDGWAAHLPQGSFDSLWLSDGVDWPGRARLRAVLDARGALRIEEPATPLIALGPARIEDGQIRLRLTRLGPAGAVTVQALGKGPDGAETVLSRAAAGPDAAEVVFDLPAELRNRITRFALVPAQGAQGVVLADDALRRRKVALVEGAGTREGLELLAPDLYLRAALSEGADLVEGTLQDMLQSAPDVIVLSDVANPPEAAALAQWVEKGGVLIRFAGPRMAAALAAAETGGPGRWRDAPEDPLLPVRLRGAGRSVGGTMSWGAPRALAPFPEGSPFAGLSVPAEVSVRRQLLAEPGPELAARTIAALEDGTPLVTRAARGAGQVVLFHVSANAEWSSIPLSGLFVAMLERLTASARVAGADGAAGAARLRGQTWVPGPVLDGFGALRPAEGMAGVPGARLAGAAPGPGLPPGLYRAGAQQVALNVVGADAPQPARWPDRLAPRTGPETAGRALGPLALVAALALLLADALAALALSGRLRGRGAALLLLVLAVPLSAPPLRADGMDIARATAAAREVVLAYVVTDDPQVDAASEAGLRGLSQTLSRRTAVEPGPPMAVDLENDDLALFTLIYWPVTPDQPAPSGAAYAQLNRFLGRGGMILFDTRDGDVSGFGLTSPAGARLRDLAAPLDIPPLAPVPGDHVLTRSFYLISGFPGRHEGAPVWVEAPADPAAPVEGGFYNANDGVTPVVIGGNDWAAAWAVDDQGRPMFPLGGIDGGWEQREMAYRFGVNLVMHVLTGNYKADQVHVPALLERLGQ
nr:DUF4159 domain-containing protein [Phaeovulum vinaykumarii]